MVSCACGGGDAWTVGVGAGVGRSLDSTQCKRNTFQYPPTFGTDFMVHVGGGDNELAFQ